MRLLTMVLFLALSATAQAENFAVQTTGSNGFSPDQLSIKPGDSVTFSNPGGGFHNVVWVEGTFDDGSQASPENPQSIWPTNPTRTFSAEGAFKYYCEQHGTPQGAGMAGTVTVATSSSPPPAGDTTPPTITVLRAGYRRHRPFVALRLSEPANVSARLVRRVRGPDRIHAEKNQDIEAENARRVISFGKRDLKDGRYYIRLVATDAAGNASPATRAPFKVD